MGFDTLVLTISLDAIALMACNPSIGGTAKGHLVREIDALGGEMAKNIDQTFIQIKMLNTSKGAAVRSLRAQADKRHYHYRMKSVLENTPRLKVKQGEVSEILIKGGKVEGIITTYGEVYRANALILATGVYMESEVIIGERKYASGPSGFSPSNGLSRSLQGLGLAMRRFKTGTPPRIDGRTIDYDKLEPQYGDEPIIPFSFSSENLNRGNQVLCYLAYTNQKTHEIIRNNLHRAPLYTGIIQGVGPRYCPSIEDKIVRFADKKRHQLFIEPEALNTNEKYLQGLSTSMPLDVQREIVNSIYGLENAEIMRPAYAIEYDCLDTAHIAADLSIKGIKGLFSAGQINGSSGYEEAAAQGLIAGINAAEYLRSHPPVILRRDQAYIGVLIDDLVTKGTLEPYRMMTARAEYRLLLRQDNADIRLSEIGHSVGLLSDEDYDRMLRRKETAHKIIDLISRTNIPPGQALNELLKEKGYPETDTAVNARALLKRPNISYKDLMNFIDLPELFEQTETYIQTEIKYEGYILRQMEEIEHVKKLEQREIPPAIDYSSIQALRLEARQKLEKIRPHTLGQASRISGVTPADVSVLLIYLEKEARRCRS